MALGPFYLKKYRCNTGFQGDSCSNHGIFLFAGFIPCNKGLLRRFAEMCRATSIPIGSTGTPSSPSSSVAMILPPITSTSTWTTFSHPEDAAVLITFQSYRPSTLDQGLNCCTMNAHYVFFISTIFTENLLPYSVIRTWPQVHGPIRSLTKDFCIIVYLDKIMQNTLMCSFMIHLVTPVAERRILNDKERSYCGIIWDSGLEFAWKG